MCQPSLTAQSDDDEDHYASCSRAKIRVHLCGALIMGSVKLKGEPDLCVSALHRAPVDQSKHATRLVENKE